MNDLRSPLEDRPYRPAQSGQTPRLAQDDASHDYEMSLFDRIRYSRWFPLGSVIAAVLIFSGIVSFAYTEGAQTGVNATTPVVAADTAAYKEKPANPGGMDVPFQDAVVFDQLQNQDQASKPATDTIESLLPPPEQPVAANAPAVTEVAAAEPTEAAKTATAVATATNEAKPAETAPAAGVTETIIKEAPEAKPLATETDPESAPIASSSAEPKNLEAPSEIKVPETAKKDVVKPAEVVAAPKPVAKPAPVVAAPKPIASPEPKPTAATAAVSSGTYRIQLGAFRDESAARSAWNSVKGQFSQLAGVTPAFPRADLGAKGVFYRAQGTNLSKESADSLCRTINASKAGSCIVTH